MYSASCESRKGSHSSVRRKSFMWERIWNRVKCLHEKESDTSLLKRQPEDLPSVMAKRLEWDRLIKSVQVRPKEIDRPYSYSTFFSLIVVLQFYLNNCNTRLTALLKNQ